MVCAKRKYPGIARFIYLLCDALILFGKKELEDRIKEKVKVNKDLTCLRK